MERDNVVTVKGGAVTLLGDEIKVGQDAPNAVVLDSDLNEVALDTFKGKIKLIATVPSLDTPVCDLQIKRFNKEALGISEDIVIIFVSMDLPFAQKRFCQENDIEKVKTYSDHRDASLGMNYGVLIKDLRLLARAIFIVDKDDKVKYVEYVPELTEQPNYDKVLEVLGTL